MRNPASGNPVFLQLMGKVEDAAVLITFVQGIVGPFNKDLRPLQNRGSEKSGNRAENDLLKKSGMHLQYSGSRRASFSASFSFEWVVVGMSGMI
jgi:hypothetical protein